MESQSRILSFFLGCLPSNVVRLKYWRRKRRFAVSAEKISADSILHVLLRRTLRSTRIFARHAAVRVVARIRAFVLIARSWQCGISSVIRAPRPCVPFPSVLISKKDSVWSAPRTRTRRWIRKLRVAGAAWRLLGRRCLLCVTSAECAHAAAALDIAPDSV